jgi:hypothetical protein
MNPGLPGLGIGGLFYLISALLMPFWALLRTLQGRPAEWRAALKHAAIALMMMGIMSASFWTVNRVVSQSAPGTRADVALTQHAMPTTLLVLGVLGTLLTFMHLLRWVTRSRRYTRPDFRTLGQRHVP